MRLKITILGCGNSSGVPTAGNYWGACDPYELRNRRTRCSIAVQSEKTTLIVDTGAEFRAQTIRENIQAADITGVLYTHAHSDHLHGIDDLRPIYFQKGKTCVDVYASAQTMAEIQERFDYLFRDGHKNSMYPQILKPHVIDSQDFTAGDIRVVPFEIDHGSCMATGYRFGDISYCVDMKHLDQKALEAMKGTKIWIVDAAAYKNPNNSVHAHLAAVYDYNAQIGAETVYITSLSTQMDYKTLEAELPEGYFPAYDGLVIHSA